MSVAFGDQTALARRYRDEQTIEIEVPPTTLNAFLCACLVKASEDNVFGAGWRHCHKTAEFWMKVPWSEAEVMVCFTHVNAKRVRLAT